MAETSIAVRLGLTGLASTQAGLKRFFGLIDKEGRAASVSERRRRLVVKVRCTLAFPWSSENAK